MLVSWNLSQIENLGYTKLNEWDNKELGRFKVEVPPVVHNDWTLCKLLKKWMFPSICSWGTSSCSSQRHFQHAQGAGPAQRWQHAECWAGVCRETGTGTSWISVTALTAFQLPAGNEFTPRSCCFRGAWAQTCLALSAGFPAQAFWRGYLRAWQLHGYH